MGISMIVINTITLNNNNFHFQNWQTICYMFSLPAIITANSEPYKYLNRFLGRQIKSNGFMLKMPFM